jgi:hypothetical protein
VRQHARLARFNYVGTSTRPAGLILVLLVFSTLLASFCAYQLIRNYHLWTALQTKILQEQRFEQHATQIAKQADAAHHSPQALAMQRATLELHSQYELNWDAVLDAIESAVHTVHGGVSILNLATDKAQRTGVELHATALANTAEIMLAFLQRLSADPRVLRIDLLNQQPEPKLGSEALRFQLIASFDPVSRLTHPQRPIAAPPITSPILQQSTLPPIKSPAYPLPNMQVPRMAPIVAQRPTPIPTQNSNSHSNSTVTPLAPAPSRALLPPLPPPGLAASRAH